MTSSELALNYVWLLGVCSAVMLALALIGIGIEQYEKYRQRKADRALRRTHEDAFVRARLNLVSQIGVVPFQRRGPQ